MVHSQIADKTGYAQETTSQSTLVCMWIIFIFCCFFNSLISLSIVLASQTVFSPLALVDNGRISSAAATVRPCASKGIHV